VLKENIMHHLYNFVVVGLIIAAFVSFLVSMHCADIRASNGCPVPVCHRSCAYVDLASGIVRAVEPSYSEFFYEHVANSFTSDGRKSRLHLTPEPV
jgi:FtsH-binding integral membrane protein